MLSLAVLACLCPLQAGPTSLPATQTDNQAEFGAVVAIDGTTLLVGARRDHTQSLFAGSVHVYEQTPQGDWDKRALFRGVPFAQAGGALAIKNNVGVVASGGLSNRTGFVIERIQGQWVETATLGNSSSGLGAGYGRSVDTNGDVIVVGATAPNGTGLQMGDVWVYRKVSGIWTQVQRLRLPPNPMTGQRPLAWFGHRVALDGNRLAVSAPAAAHNGVAQAGAVMTYTFSGGQFVQDGMIPPPPLPGSTRFGFHGLSMDGGLIAVGASNASVGGVERAGVVKIYSESSTGTWTEQASLPDPRPTHLGLFGMTLDLDGDRLVVSRFPYGRQQYGPGMLDPESYLSVTGPSGSTWVQQPAIADPLAANDNWYGSDVALSGDRLVVGSSRAMVNGYQPGSVHAGSISGGWVPTVELVCTGGPCSCPSTTGWEGCGNSYSRFGRLSAIGSSSVSADDLQLTASSLGAASFARLALGPGRARPTAFGDGALCIQAARRLAPVAPNAIGRVTFPTGVVALAANQLGAAGMILAGETWVFQVIYDEPSRVFPCPGKYGYNPATGLWDGRPFLTARGFNLTNGLAITFRP